MASTTTQADTTTDNNNKLEDVVSSSSLYIQNAQALEKLRSPFLKIMRDRGFLHQCTGIEELDEIMMEEKISAYLGFDATADSLHVGSLLQIMILRHLQKCGHRPVVLIGGGTSKVGDPTGKDASRVLLTDEIVEYNAKCIASVFETFLEFENDAEFEKSAAILVNNDVWLSQLKYLEFLREFGTLFTINRMLSFESVKQRLQREAPFSFLEFNYMILQAYDFVELYKRHDVVLQLGGSDQWGNMISGVELGRKVLDKTLFAMTAPLITTSDGKKMGKTANGAIWLDKEKLSEYEYWQFWRNTDDDDVIRFLKLFTEMPLREIEDMEKNFKGAELNEAKIVLADRATALLHGEECLKQIHETVRTMFGSTGGTSTEGLPRVTVSQQELGNDGIKLLDLFVRLGLATSKKDARRLISGGGARIGDDKIQDENAILTVENFDEKKNNEITLRAGKKRAGVVELSSS